MQRPFEGNPVVHDDYDPSKRTASRPVSIQNNLFGAEEPQEFTPSTVPLRLSPNEALAKARSAKFRTYTIVNHTRSSLTEIKTGCTGESGEAQRNVAALQNKIIAERKEKDPLFQVESIDFQGDNIYPYGAKSPDDPEFKNKIHDVYPKDRRGRSVLGNHDRREDNPTEIRNGLYNTAEKALSYLPYLSQIKIPGYETGIDVGIYQIAHTYMQNDPTYFDNSTLDFQKFPPYAMPAQATSYINKQVEEYFLDSNSYGLDWLNYMEQWSTNPNFNQEEAEKNNQSAWCEATYRASQRAGRFVIFNQHHPMPNTLSKRYINYDWDLYLKEPLNAQRLNRLLELDANSPTYKEEVAAVFKGTDPKVATMPKNCNYNWALWQIIHVKQKMSPKIVFAAHDHCEYVYINQPENPQDKVVQVVVGGGGSSDLHPRRNFGNHANVGTFMNKHGFCLMTIPDLDNPRLEDIKLEIFNVDGEHLVFNADSPIPIRSINADLRVENFRRLALRACSTFQDSLHNALSQYRPNLFSAAKQKLKIRSDLDPHMDCLHDVMNFLNQPELPGFDETVQKVIDRFKKQYGKNWTTQDLATMIDNQLKSESPEAKSLGLNFLEAEKAPAPI